jgi:uncharacterized membrane protein
MIWFRLTSAHYLFLLMALLFGIIFIKTIPPFWGVDEIVHFDRAYQVSTGNFVEDKLSSTSYGGQLPADTIRMQKYVFADLLDNKGRHEVDSTTGYKQYEAQKPSHQLQSYDFTSSGGYSPLAYAPPAIGIYTARHLGLTNGGIFFTARFVSLLFYVGLIFGALWLLRGSQFRWIVMVVSLLPMSLFQASIVNVDSLVIGLSLLMFALLINAWQRSKPLSYKMLTLILACGLCLSLTKPNYFLLYALVVFLPASSLPAGKKILWRAGLIILPLIFILAWNHTASPMLHAGLVEQKGPVVASAISTSGQVKNIARHPIGAAATIARSATNNNWADSTFGLLGYNFVLIPGFVIMALVFCLSMATFYRAPPSKNVLSTKLPDLMLADGLLVFISIIGAFYLQYNPVGTKVIDGIQGRYFIPLLPFILLGLSRLLPIKITMGPRLATALFGVLLSLSLISSILYYHYVTY